MRAAVLPAWFVPAPPLESYPRLPYRGEDGRAVLRRAACACGADVEQLSGEDPMTAVQRHNAAADHLLWRAIRDDTPQGGCTPTAGPSRVDLSAAPPVRSVPALRQGA